MKRGHLFAVAIWLVVAPLWNASPSAAETDLPQDLADAEQLFRSAGPESALPEFERLLARYQGGGDRASIAVIQTMLGECHWRLGEFEKAEGHLQAALELAREVGNPEQEGRVRNLQGLLEWDRGNFAAASEHFRAATVIAQEIGDLKMQGATLNNLSLVLDELGEYDTSLAQYQRALEIYAQTDFPRGKGDTLGNIGGLHLLLGHYSEAVNYYQQALEISKQLDSLPAQSQDHGNLGYAYTGLGQFRLALEHFQTALQLAEQAGMRLEQGYWLRGMAQAHLRSGRPDLALSNNQAALDIYRSTGAKSLRLESLHDFGELMLELGDPVSAEQYFREAMELARAINQSRGITLNLLALGQLQFRLQHLDQAKALYLQALERTEKNGEQALQVSALLSLAALNISREDYLEARRTAIRAMETAREIQSLGAQCEAGLIIAGITRELGNHEGALAEYAILEPLVAELRDPDLAWQLEYGRALAFIGLGEKPAAETALQNAVKHIESVRSRLQERRFRTGYLQDKHQVYIELVRLQMELGRNREALSTAERLRTLSFNEQANTFGGEWLDAEATAQAFELRERIRQLQRTLNEERGLPGPEQRQAAIRHFSRELLLAEQQYQAYLDDAAAAGQTVPSARTVDAASTIHANLGPREALIEYVVADDRVMIFVVRPDHLHATARAIDQVNLYSQIQLLRDLIQQRDGSRWIKPAVRLTENLIVPMIEAAWLEGVERLYLVPHGVLNYLPFALLPAAGASSPATLVDHYTLAYLPTAFALPAIGAGGNDDLSLLGVAPDRSRLRHAPEEAQSVAQLFEPHSRMLSGKAATESLFVEIAPHYQVLHLATHGYFNKFSPLLSGLELEADGENDGLLEVHEILQIRLNSELVTLSACETGLASGYFSEFPAGDDFVGMTRAFLQAGSAAVLASLWEVDDRSTVDFMKHFYEGLAADGGQANKALALALAQRAIKSREEYRHPYYWAPFILVGSMDSGTVAGT